VPVTVKNLTDEVVQVPLVNYQFGPREARTFEFQEFDQMENNRVVKHLVDEGIIQLVSGASGLVAVHATTHEAAGTDVVQHQDLSGAGSNTHAQLDAHVADITTNPHDVSFANLGATNLTGLDSVITDADLASILFRYDLAAKSPEAFKQLSYTGTSLTKVELYDGTVVRAAAGRTLQFADSNPDGIVASTGDFTAEDFSAGEYVGVQGTTNNDGIYLIGSVAATTITLDAAETLIAEGPLSSGASLHALDQHLFTQDLTYTAGSLTGILVTHETTSNQVLKVLTYSGNNLVQVSLQAV